MSKEQWRDGPPPSQGWWIASTAYNSEILRWWNGECWSCAAATKQSPDKAAQNARIPTEYPPYEIQWLPRPDSWPERSKT